MQHRAILPIVILSILLASCRDEAPKSKPIGEAYTGPLVLNIRQEISPNSKTVATLHHGEHVDIVQVKRRFIKVRTNSGIEGWTDQRQLISVDQMKEIQDFGKVAAKLPAEGVASVFSTLNIHSEPNRFSPSVYQITEGMKVEVIGHKVAARATQAPTDASKTPLVKIAPPPVRKRKEKELKGVPPPPRAPAPEPPKDWLELSRMGRSDEDHDGVADVLEKKEEKPSEPVKLEDWSLVRTKDGKAGWVLTRMLNMLIPDEVAQYAEGKRITSYFSLGKVHDDELNVDKNNWLWTTRSDTPVPYDFDSFRVFFYNRKKHRYETYYIEKGVEGYFPVEAKPGTAPVFAVIVRDDDDGKLYKKTFTFVGYKFFLTSKTPYNLPVENPPVPGIQTEQLAKAQEAQQPPPKASLLDRFKDWTKKLRGKG